MPPAATLGLRPAIALIAIRHKHYIEACAVTALHWIQPCTDVETGAVVQPGPFQDRVD
jgi:hypothetical protein